MNCLAELLTAAPAPVHSLYPLWTVNFLATAFASFFLLRQVLRGPSDLLDAAKIDGCGFWSLCRHVMLPLVRPALGILGLFVLVAALDDAMAPLIDASTPPAAGFYALHLTAPGIRIGEGSLGLLMAASILVAPPLIAIFFFAARRFRKSEAPASIKP
jgi:cellobiose transport system permease protein